jgi:hypothetical protein
MTHPTIDNDLLHFPGSLLHSCIHILQGSYHEHLFLPWNIPPHCHSLVMLGFEGGVVAHWIFNKIITYNISNQTLDNPISNGISLVSIVEILTPTPRYFVI